MREFFDAVATATKVVVFTVLHAFIMIPMALVCLVLSIVLLPLDVIAYVLSFGEVKFPVFLAFQVAAKTVFTWYGSAIERREA